MAVRKDIEEALRGQSVEELLETRQFIERLLAELETRQGSKRLLPPGMTERRRFDRYAIDLRVTCFRHSTRATMGPGGAPVQDAVVRDISRSGLRFFTAQALKANELLTVYLPGAVGVRKLFVEVMRVTQRGDQYECGASFVGLDRVLAAQKVEEERGEVMQVLVVCEPCAERDTLCKLLVNQGYTVHVANGVPEACSMLEVHSCGLVVASAPLLLSEGRRLLDELAARGEDCLTVAIVRAYEMDGPAFEPLRACHDFLSEPTSAQEVRVVMGRVYRRLTAKRTRQAPPQAP